MLTTSSIEMREGTLLDYRLRLRGIPIRWQSEISVWQPPNRFVDRQIRGPYTLWVHEHTFSEDCRGTVIGDSVWYSTLGGELIQKFLIAPDLEKIFSYRHQMLKNLFNPKQQKSI
jgi:ligand-binding SRPBCC domain-containing protein